MNFRWFKPAHSSKLRLQFGTKVGKTMIWKMVPVVFENPAQEEMFFNNIPDLKDLHQDSPPKKKIVKLPVVEKVG